MSRRDIKTILTIILLALTLATKQLAKTTTPATTPTPQQAAAIGIIPDGFVRVARTIDGDTIELTDGTKVRYLGVDTPETVSPKKPVQCYGHEASDYNKSLVEGKAVKLVRDAQDMDMYGRQLRFVYLPDGTFVNLALMMGGYARVLTIPPNTAHARDFQDAQATAKANSIGLWGACPSASK